jgi:hypothetical protein
MGDTADSRVGAMLGLGAGWVLVCFFAVAPVSAAVAFLAGIAGRPALVSVIAFAAAVEAVVYLVFALAVFRGARMLRLPRASWLLGPAGYLVAFGLYIAVMLLLGDTMAVPRGEGWVFVALDTVVTAFGAWVMTRRSAPEVTS